jgi:dihydrofolate reductase
MMKTTVFIGTSLDGFIAREDGDIDWLTKFENPEVIEGFEKFIGGIDAIVMGRGTFEKVLTFPYWPHRQKVFVLSTSIRNVPFDLKQKAAIISMEPAKLLEFLSGEGYSGIYVDGGRVIQQFLKADCIDELIITRAPVLLGSGLPLFGYLDKDLYFEHSGTHVYSNGLVMSHYIRRA